jgi:hypothetical protein
MQKNMGLVKRQPGERRWGMLDEFPLTDSDGVRVVHERRDGDERRKASAALEDLLILFSQPPSEDPGKKH